MGTKIMPCMLSGKAKMKKKKRPHKNPNKMGPSAWLQVMGFGDGRCTHRMGSSYPPQTGDAPGRVVGGLSLLDLEPFLVSKIDHLGHLGLAMGKEGCSGSVSVRGHLWVWAGTQLRRQRAGTQGRGTGGSALLRVPPSCTKWFFGRISRSEALHRLQAMGDEQGPS